MGGDRAGHPEDSQEFSHRRYGELSPRFGGDGPDGGGWRTDDLAACEITSSIPLKRRMNADQGAPMKLLFAGLLALLPLAASAQAPVGMPHPTTEKPASCAPSMGLNFVCGLNQPEDLLQIGASKWVIASGMGEGAGISIIDSQAKTARRFFTGASRPDLKMYPDFATAPVRFNSHGIALRSTRAAGLYT